jgi:hypothetical protein
VCIVSFSCVGVGLLIFGKCRFINTIKYVKMAASSNFGNVFSVLGEFSSEHFVVVTLSKLGYSGVGVVAVSTHVAVATFGTEPSV